LQDVDLFSCPIFKGMAAFCSDIFIERFRRAARDFWFQRQRKTSRVSFVSRGSDMSTPGMIDALSLAGLKREKPRRFSLRGFFLGA
jgi:hypothetical protein